MKNVLLTTTALVAFAGAASAVEIDLAWSGSAEAGYNQTSAAANPDSDYDSLTAGEFYAWGDANLDVTLTQELNNGAVASLALSSFVGWDSGTTWLTATPTWVAMVDTSYGSLSFGDIDNVNLEAFAEVAGMASTAATSAAFGTGVHMVRAETTLGGYSIAASANADASDVAVQVSGDAGSVAFALFYETTIMGLNASTSVGGMDLTFAYVDNAGTYFGVGVGYAVSSTISASASYASNLGVSQIAVGVAYADGGITAAADYDVTAGVLDLEAGYSMEVQPGMTVSVGVTVGDATNTAVVGYTADVAYIMGDLGMYAGIDDASNMYAGVNYDLGGGASAFAYTADLFESGPLEWHDGARAGVAFTF